MAKHSRNHVVTKGHLALFAKNGLLDCHFTDGSMKRLSPNDVAVRKDFFVSRHSGGVRDTSFEEGMAVHESEAVPVLRAIAKRWPLDVNESAVLAEYLGLQVVRSPAFRRLLDAKRTSVLGDLRDERRGALTASQWVAFERETQTDATRLAITGRMISRAATLLGSMHWTLVRFSSPDLVISDHPLVAVPLGTGPAGVGRTGVPATHAHGLADLLEVRFPIDPRHLLLLSWADVSDDVPIVSGRRTWFRELNATVVAQAEKHWMHRPGRNPPHVADIARPLSTTLYGARALDGARGGQRHTRAWRNLNQLLETDAQGLEMRLLRTDAPANASPALRQGVL